PAKPRNFVIAVAIIAATSWLIGFALAPARWQFLLSTEWQTQPFYLATHFLCLRLFVTCYTRNFLAAAAHTTMPAGEAERRIKHILGPWGGGLALLLALPLCIANIFYLLGNDYAQSAAYANKEVAPSAGTCGESGASSGSSTPTSGCCSAASAS